MGSKLDKKEREGSTRWPSRVCITAEGLPEWVEKPQGHSSWRLLQRRCVFRLLIICLYSYWLDLCLVLLISEASILVDPQIREAGRGSSSHLSHQQTQVVKVVIHVLSVAVHLRTLISEIKVSQKAEVGGEPQVQGCPDWHLSYTTRVCPTGERRGRKKAKRGRGWRE